jgi:uncharacterized membrane protein YqgA involved in biofilm formation
VLGTLINIASVFVGSTIGILSGQRFPERVRQTVIASLGVFTMAVGVSLFIDSMGVDGENVLVPLISLLVGGILGEWWRIERRLKSLGAWLEARFAIGVGEAVGENRFVRGFLSASLLFCVGPMTILGSIQDGLTGDYRLLVIKSVLDGFAAIALASSLGIGVMFSVIVILLYQGGISLLAAQATAFFSDIMLAELTAVGGILLLSLSIGSILELRPIRSGNLLPALLVAPILVLVLQALGIG